MSLIGLGEEEMKFIKQEIDKDLDIKKINLLRLKAIKLDMNKIITKGKNVKDNLKLKKKKSFI